MIISPHMDLSELAELMGDEATRLEAMVMRNMLCMVPNIVSTDELAPPRMACRTVDGDLNHQENGRPRVKYTETDWRHVRALWEAENSRRNLRHAAEDIILWLSWGVLIGIITGFFLS